MFRGSEIARRYGRMCQHFMVGWVNCSRAVGDTEDLPEESVANWFACKIDEAIAESIAERQESERAKEYRPE